MLHYITLHENYTAHFTPVHFCCRDYYAKELLSDSAARIIPTIFIYRPIASPWGAMQKYEKSCRAFISEWIGVIFGTPVGRTMLWIRFAIFFQNDPLTNFMHIFRKQSFHNYDLPKIYIFCGACHSMSTVKIWGK